MKTRILITIMAAAARSLLAADSDAKAEVTAAAKTLSGENYIWKSTMDFGNFSSTTKGKTDKEGQMTLSIMAGDNTREAVLQKGGKGAIKSPEEGWQSLSELENASGGGRGRQFLLRRLQNFKAPADEAADLLAKVKDLKKEGDAYSGELTEAGAKDLLTRGRRRGGDAPEAKNAKASVKFWVKDGQLTKYELKQQGTVTIGGNERDIDGTTTVEISDVGTTKVEIPDDAKKKLS